MATGASRTAGTRIRRQPDEPRSRKAARAALVGTIIEYYEFGTFGYLTAVLAPQFFAGQTPAAALLGTLAIFGSSFVIRPLGGVILGRLGDIVGRRVVLLTTVIGMGAATAITGLLPTYAQIGIWAPILLLLVRLAQGFFAGGEITGAATYVAESAPAGRRGYYGSFTPVGVAIGGGFAAAVVAGTTTIFGDEALRDWAWRIPFLVSVPLVILSILVRRTLEEAHAFEELKEKKALPDAPLGTVLRHHRGPVLRVILIGLGHNAGHWVGLIFMNIYMTEFLDIPRLTVYWTLAAVCFFSAAWQPFYGSLSDRHGRRRILTIGFLGYSVLAVPTMAVMGMSSLPLVIVAMFVLALPNPIVQAVGYSTYAEQFPTAVRYTGLSLSFNIATILGGGITPLIATSLIASTGNVLWPAFIVICTSAVALVTLIFTPETSTDELRQH
jgi:MHS family proline/betaine transporter-like MFS transporter